jgi:hypothetical protein
MVHDLGLPVFLCPKAYGTIVYIMNGCPHRVFKNKTPKEAFIGEKPQVSHFYVFSCPIYIHIPMEKRTKLESSSLKGAFVGYNESSKAYKVYIVSQQKIVVNRDMKFHEDAWSSRSQERLMEVEKGETRVIPKVDPEKSKVSKSEQQGSKDGIDASVPSSLARKPRWLTQTLWEAQEQVTTKFQIWNRCFNTFQFSQETNIARSRRARWSSKRILLDESSS